AWLDDEHLHGELRSDSPQQHRFRVVEENHRFESHGAEYYRCNEIWRESLAADGTVLGRELLLENRALVMYEPSESDAVVRSSTREGE
ncbi:hypothetical protein JW921_09605, partial [Candidatus Fermentibacterales bacterium]|nr:hypothetical protein [Candidatus Fermentibacterales bacterium]